MAHPLERRHLFPPGDLDYCVSGVGGQRRPGGAECGVWCGEL